MMIDQNEYGRTSREEAKDKVLMGIFGAIMSISFLIFMGFVVETNGGILVLIFIVFVLTAIINYFSQFIDFIINRKIEKFMKEMYNFYLEKTRKEIAKKQIAK